MCTLPARTSSNSFSAVTWRSPLPNSSQPMAMRPRCAAPVWPIHHHLPVPDAHANHLRVNMGTWRLRWELHTEFVTWTFMRSIAAQGGTERDPEVALDAVPQQWFAELPGECLACLHLWVLPAKEETVMPWLE